MKIKTCAKINLGLNIVGVRPDGYHDLETVFYPVPIYDTIVIDEQTFDNRQPFPAMLSIEGDAIDCSPQNNLVVRAYNALNERYGLPRVNITLRKRIPSQAGMGGGSSDCAATLRLLRDMYLPEVKDYELEEIAAKLGADCAFFIKAQAAYAEGIGDLLQPVKVSLSGWWIAIVRPDIPVSTGAAYKLIQCKTPAYNCKDTVTTLPVEKWRTRLCNDFEEPVFEMEPRLGEIVDELYAMGATYAAMSGSGSALFGLFKEKPCLNSFDAPGTFTWVDIIK